MRLLSVLLVSSAIAVTSAQAQIDYQGAKDLERKFTAFLPEKLAAAGLIKVRPGTDDYEVTLDPTVLLKDVDPKTFSISGLKPWLSLLRPLDDGQWQFRQNADLDVKGHVTAGTEKTDFAYKIDAMRADGIVDPELFYFKSAEMSADGIFISTRSPQQSLEARFGSMKTTLDTKRATPQTIDVRSNTVMNAFSESIIDPQGMRVDLSAGSLTADVALNGFTYKSFQELVFFVLDKVKKERLEPGEQGRLKDLVRANLPMFDTLLESIDMADLKVDTPAGAFGAENVRYTISSNGLRDKANVGIGFTVEKPSIPAGLVPDTFTAALPQDVTVRMSLDNIDLASGIGYFLDHADFNSDNTLSDEHAAAIGRIFLPGGALTIRYEDVSARSSIYDFSLSGTTTVYPEQQGRQNTDVTLYARDLDKTISYLQDNAQAVPEFGQAAFMALMIKGFAKPAPDGRQMWSVVVDEAGHTTVNGQEMAIPH